MIDGKRYSRREVTPVDPADRAQLDAALAPGCGDRVAHYIKVAAGYLESKGLPAAPTVYWWQSLNAWRPELPHPEARRPYPIEPDKTEVDRLHQLLDAATGGRGQSSGAPVTVGIESRLLSYHLSELGYARDSLEELAARIIVLAHLLRQAKRESLKLNLAMELQEAATLARVYGMEISTAKRNGSRAKAFEWAKELADELKAKYSKFPAAWNSIPKGDGGDKRYADHEVWREGEVLRASNSEAGDSRLSKESFRTGYFSKVKL